MDDTTEDSVRCDGSRRCGHHHAVVGVYRCCCGLPWVNKSCASGAKAGEPTAAPVTAEGLRERTCDGSDDPAKRCGRHHPTENGNLMGGYDCCCGQPWLASYDHCMSEARRGDAVSVRDQVAAALRYEGGDLNEDQDVYDLADAVLAALAGDPGDLPARMLAKAREAGFVYDRSALIGRRPAHPRRCYVGPLGGRCPAGRRDRAARRRPGCPG